MLVASGNCPLAAKMSGRESTKLSERVDGEPG